MTSNLPLNKAALISLATLLFCMHTSLFQATAFAGSKDFPTPDWLNRTQIATTMIINGLPSSVHHFEAHKDLEQLLEFYRRQWNDGSDEKPGYKEVYVSSWHVISRLEDHHLYTVQVQQNDDFSITGYLAVADLKAMKKAQKNITSVAQMNGSQVINDVTSFDPGRKGRTLMLTNNYSTTSNSSFYRNYYQDRGWQKIMDNSEKEASIIVFRKNDKEVHLVINHIEGATQIVMNLVENT